MMVRSLPVSWLASLVASHPEHSCYVMQRYDRYFIELEDDYDTYMSSFSSKTRSTLRRKMKKFQQAGGSPEANIYRSVNELTEFHRLARSVSQKTYQEIRLNAGLPDSPSFVAEMKDKASRQEVVGFLLFMNDRPVSYLYTPIEEGTVLYAYLGYDPACAVYSPGTLLQLLALHHFFSRTDCQFFDFTGGEGAHKSLFGTGHIPSADVALLTHSLSNRLLIASHKSFNGAVASLSAVTERLGIQSRLRRLLKGAS